MDHTRTNYSFNWRNSAQSLPTAILRSVIDANQNPYARLYEALNDLLRLTNHDFKGYVLVQAFGHDHAQLRHEIEACSDLALNFNVVLEPQDMSRPDLDQNEAHENVKHPHT